jgi:hypothetical protein
MGVSVGMGVGGIAVGCGMAVGGTTKGAAVGVFPILMEQLRDRIMITINQSKRVDLADFILPPLENETAYWFGRPFQPSISV